jgi:hypothetical protein
MGLVVATIVIMYGKQSVGPTSTDPVVADARSPLRDAMLSDQPTPSASIMSSPASPTPLVVDAEPSVASPETTAPATPTTPVLTPIVIQAEKSSNTLIGGAKVVTCATCEGGARVGYVAGASQLFANTFLPHTGNRTVRVTFESDGPRLIKVSANGTLIAQRQVTGPGWQTPVTFEFTASLTAGQLRLGFYNDVGPAPDIDMITIY